jgi:hypothetical protein
MPARWPQPAPRAKRGQQGRLHHVPGRGQQIDHLDTIRLNFGSEDEVSIGVRIAQTRIAANEDVIWPEFDIRWIRRQGTGSVDLTPISE